MTAQRLVRGGKARIVLGVCGVLLVLAAIFHHENIVSDYENIKRRYETCTQQSESLSVNLQDYKNKLEKSLQQEKQEHKQTRTELETRINAEKQHYKLLEAKHDDVKLQSDKLQQDHITQIDEFHDTIKQLREQLKLAEEDKEKSLERLKSEFMQLQIDKKELEKKSKGHNDEVRNLENKSNHLEKENHQLKRKIEQLQERKIRFTNLEAEDHFNNAKPSEEGKNFSKMVEVDKSVYQIQINNQPTNNESKKEDQNAHQIKPPKQPEDENQVLPKPDNNSRSSLKPNLNSVPTNEKIEQPQPLLVPSATPETKKNDEEKQSGVVIQSPMDEPKIKLPKGVVPIPISPNDVHGDMKIPEEINQALPNRYINNIIESEMQNEIAKEMKDDKKEDKLKFIPQRVPEVMADEERLREDNNAMEVMDQPKVLDTFDNNLEEKAQVNPPIKDTVVQLMDKRRKQHIDTLGKGEEGVIKAPAAAGAGANYEHEPDYAGDKDHAEQKDLLIEDNDPQEEGEEDDDADDYDLAARQKDPAVRN